MMNSATPGKTGFRIFRISAVQLAIPVITGVCIALISYPQGFRSLHFIPFLLMYSLALGIPCMKAFEYTEWKLNKHVSWLENPWRRFFLSVILELVLGILILVVINILFYGVVQKQGSGTLIGKTTEGLVYLVISIVGGILLVNSLHFLRSWKQAAVNAEMLRMEKLAAEYEALKNQVNPHFLFNSLTALSSLVYKDPDKAIAFIRELSNVFRYVLESREEEVVSFAQENKFLESVIFLNQIRYEAGLQVTNSLTGATDRFILPMALQMLVENAIKHNSVTSGKPLSVEIFEENGFVVVRNNLQPLKSEMVSNKLGLRNIVSRYGYLTNQDVFIEKTEDQFIVKLPVLYATHV
jgi:sensor histidine kinase YesM